MIDRSTYTIDSFKPLIKDDKYIPPGEPLTQFTGQPTPENLPTPSITATPFSFINPDQIARRRWLYGKHMIRAYASVTVAPGGVGKSSLLIAEALAIATGRNLLGIRPDEQASVWIWNGEDPLDELQRRITAAMLHHDIKHEEIEGRLFVDSGRKQSLILAETCKTETKVSAPLEDQLVKQLSVNHIGLLVVDPFVSSHRVTENDNNAIDAVVKAWARIADRANCAIELVHHVRKTNGNEATVEDGRGASALIAAARSARVLNQMTVEEAEKAGIENRKAFFKVEIGKANLFLPSDKANWFQLVSVNLGNGPDDAKESLGDCVGAVDAWQWPSALDNVTVADLLAVQTRIEAGQWREDARSDAWAGKVVAEVLALNSEDRAAKHKIASLLKTWIGNGALKIVLKPDSKRMEKKFVEVGQWAI